MRVVIVEGEAAVLGVNLRRPIVTSGEATRSSQITFGKTCYHVRATKAGLLSEAAVHPFVCPSVRPLFRVPVCLVPRSSKTRTSMLDVVDADVSQRDSGNYTCEVRGPQSTLLGHVTHYLFVRGTTAAAGLLLSFDGDVKF